MTSISELQVGNTVKDSTLLDWIFMSPVPQIVAECWLIEQFPHSMINSKETFRGAIKSWEVGIGVVVETMTTLPGEERLILLHKLERDKFFLLQSKETRPCRIEINDPKV